MISDMRIESFEDSSNNGLQVENRGDVRAIACGVDGCDVCADDKTRHNCQGAA